MSQDTPTPVERPALGNSVLEAIRKRFAESHAAQYGVSEDEFQGFVSAVVLRSGAALGQREQLELIAALHLRDLVLTRACTAGNDRAWEEFVGSYRHEMQAMARQITRDDAAGRELADGLLAELYGLPNREGRRISKFDYYMGRGSLRGWLRTVLAQQYVNHYRSRAKDVSLEERVEAGESFAAPVLSVPLAADHQLAKAVEASLAELDSEDRFLLASYYLDRRTLADIGRQLRVHESTISRKLEKVATALRKQVRRRLEAEGIDRRRCDELCDGLDVRDLNVNVAENLRQERSAETF